MKIIVTGGCGFIGANLIHKLNRFGIFDIIIVDKVNKHKAPYLKKIKFTDLIEKKCVPIEENDKHDKTRLYTFYKQNFYLRVTIVSVYIPHSLVIYSSFP